MRAWLHTEESKRRTLQRSDIAAAISKSDMFDFLIDIVPREEVKGKRETMDARAGIDPRSGVAPEMMMMYGFPPQQQQAASALNPASYAHMANQRAGNQGVPSNMHPNMWFLQQQQQQQQQLQLQWQLAMQQQQQLQQQFQQPQHEG